MKAHELSYLSGLCWFSPAVLQTLLPAVGVTDTLVDDVVPSLSQSTEGATGERKQTQEYLHSEPPAEVLNSAPSGSFHENTWTFLCVFVVTRWIFNYTWGWRLSVEKIFHFANAQMPLLVTSQEVAVNEESRVVRLEQRVMELWEQVEAAGQWAEQRHREVMKLYTEVLQGGGRGEAWLTGLMEQQLQRFRTLLGQKRRQVRPNPPVKALEFYINSLKRINMTLNIERSHVSS